MKGKARTIVLLTSIVSVTMHILNRLLYSFATAKDLLGCMENQYYEWRFGKMRYTKRGSGNPILLVHDLTPGSSSYEFHKLIDSLSKTNEVYAADLLGYGLSDKPNLTYTNYLYVQLLTDFIKNVIGKKTDLITTGDSTTIAVMTCHNDPDVINRLLFINPQNLFFQNQIPSKQTKLLKLLIDSPVLGTFIYNLLTCRTRIEKEFLEECYYDTSLLEESTILAYMEAAHLGNYYSKFSFSSYVGKYMNTNMIHALKEINHCIYIIAGEEKKDIKNMIANYEYYNSSIETAYIPKTKHLPHLESNVKVLSQIEIFLG